MTIRVTYSSRMQPDIKEALSIKCKESGMSMEEAIEEALLAWMGRPVDQTSPLSKLTKDERYLAEGLILALKANDQIISGSVVTLRARIKEKGYEHKAEATGQREEHPRRKVAG